jgi:hypothetical protein
VDICKKFSTKSSGDFPSLMYKNIQKQVLEKQHTIALKQQKALVLLAANVECEKKLLLSIKERLQTEIDVLPKLIRDAELSLILTSVLCLF